MAEQTYRRPRKPCPTCGTIVDIDSRVSELDARRSRLDDAVVDVCWRAVPYGETEDGDIYAYIVTKGAMHRLIGAAQGAGVHASFRAIGAIDDAPDPTRHDPADAADGGTAP